MVHRLVRRFHRVRDGDLEDKWRGAANGLLDDLLSSPPEINVLQLLVAHLTQPVQQFLRIKTLN